MMMNKKGILGILGLIYMFTIIVVLGLLIWFGFRISAGLVAVAGFFRTWWWAILLVFGVFIFRTQLRAVLNAILGKVGVKV